MVFRLSCWVSSRWQAKRKQADRKTDKQTEAETASQPSNRPTSQILKYLSFSQCCCFCFFSNVFCPYVSLCLSVYVCLSASPAGRPLVLKLLKRSIAILAQAQRQTGRQAGRQTQTQRQAGRGKQADGRMQRQASRGRGWLAAWLAG